MLSARNDFQQRWDYLVKGDAASGLPPMPASMAGQQAQLQADWDKVRRNAKPRACNRLVVATTALRKAWRLVRSDDGR